MHRGDDWRYAGVATMADAAYNPAARMFEITRVQGGEIVPAVLLELIHQTWEQLAGNKVFLVLYCSTRSALSDLATASVVAWEEFKQPHSSWARILHVVRPSSPSKQTSFRDAT